MIIVEKLMNQLSSNDNLITQMQGLESLYNHQNLLDEDKQKIYQRMCVKKLVIVNF